jgi:U4/U6.U5 tri-snRNP-associated protein 1
MASVDIDEINKIRKAVGLPLLPSASGPQPDGPAFKDHSESDDSDGEPASTLETREAAGYENFRHLQDEERRRLERERRKKEIQKHRDAATKFAKLEGKGLGDVDDEGDVDAKAWLKGSKKRQTKLEKERAERLAAELAERERLAAVEYTSSDLAGVRVAHEVGDFDNGDSEQILTLQDTEVAGDDDSEEDDVLENAEVVARDKLKDKLDLKKKVVYDVHDDPDNKPLLSQYDEKKRKAFTLDGQGAIAETREAKRQQIGDKLKSMVTLDILKPDPVSDYMEIKMKKPKKSKKSSKRQRADDDEDGIFQAQNGTPADAMDLDGPKVPAQPKSKARESTFNDDEDLASALSFSRRAALKKQKRKAEDLVKQLKEEEEEAAMATPEIEGGITLDETTNFLDNLSNRPQEEEPRPRPKVQPSVEQPDQPDTPTPQSEDQDQVMGEAHSGVENEDELLERIRRETSANAPDTAQSGLGEEETLDQGLGAAMSLLKKRGIVKGTDASDRNALYKARQDFLIEAQLREHTNEQKARSQRERDRESGKMKNMSAKEREEHARWQNTQREHQSSIQAAAAFNRDYKPDVQIKYVDEDGRLMNQKEAFKHLSHQFHGKGSGKQKTEKRIKKLEEEKKRMATSVLDSSKATGMHNAAGAQSKKNKEAGVRLA